MWNYCVETTERLRFKGWTKFLIPMSPSLSFPPHLGLHGISPSRSSSVQSTSAEFNREPTKDILARPRVTDGANCYWLWPCGPRSFWDQLPEGLNLAFFWKLHAAWDLFLVNEAWWIHVSRWHCVQMLTVPQRPALALQPHTRCADSSKEYPLLSTDALFQEKSKCWALNAHQTYCCVLRWQILHRCVGCWGT